MRKTGMKSPHLSREKAFQSPLKRLGVRQKTAFKNRLTWLCKGAEPALASQLTRKCAGLQVCGSRRESQNIISSPPRRLIWAL
jgi:hypothetical protein